MTKQFYLTMQMLFAAARNSKEPCRVLYVDFYKKEIAIPSRIKNVR